MKTVEIEDHQAALTKLNEHLRINPEKTAVVTVDMHRGHLDPMEATLPAPFEEAERVCQHGHDLLTFARAKGIPVVHVVAVFREGEVDKINPRIAAAGIVLSKSTPKTDAQRRGLPHNLIGSVQTELMPEIGPEKGDYIIDNKKSFSVFHGTELDRLLRIVLQVDTVVLMGINTNTCVQCGAFESFNLGYKTIVISDCVASMYGQDLHLLGLQNIGRCLGWVLAVKEFKEKVEAFKVNS